MIDPARLYTSLLNTGLQQKDNPLYQVIHDLIGLITSQQKVLAPIISGGSVGPQGIQGIQGVPGNILDESYIEERILLCLPSSIRLQRLDVYGTSTFYDILTAAFPGGGGLIIDNGNVDASIIGQSYLTFQTNHISRWFLGMSAASATGNFDLYDNIAIGTIFSVNKTTGIITFTPGIVVTGPTTLGTVLAGLITTISPLIVHSNGTAQRIEIGATGDSGTSSELRLFQDSTHFNWQIGVGTLINNCITFTPSTVINGTTFTTPIFIIALAGTTSTAPHTVSSASGALLTIDNSNADGSIINSSYMTFKTAGTARWFLGMSAAGGTGNFDLYDNIDGFNVFSITKGTGIFQLFKGLALSANITKYNNIDTVKNGIPSEYAAIDTTGLTANVAASTLYVVPASGEGLYRISAYVVLTVIGSLSSVLPNVQVVYTDKDSNTSVTLDVTPILGVAGIGQTGALSANSVGTVASGVVPIYVKLSTTIQYQTVNYASNLAGMTYALHIRLELM